MKINKQNKKVKVVMDWEDLLGIALCLAESPVKKNRMLALKIKNAMADLNRREEREKG